jgi:hypothetical protein
MGYPPLRDPPDQAAQGEPLQDPVAGVGVDDLRRDLPNRRFLRADPGGDSPQRVGSLSMIAAFHSACKTCKRRARSLLLPALSPRDAAQFVHIVDVERRPIEPEKRESVDALVGLEW